MGDNRTGEGDGDDEVIKVKLNDVPSDYSTLAVAVTIYDADAVSYTHLWNSIQILMANSSQLIPWKQLNMGGQILIGNNAFKWKETIQANKGDIWKKQE